MAFNRDKADAPYRKRNNFHRKKKVCVFCGKDNTIDYKDTAKLRKYVSQKDYRHMRDSSESADRSHQESTSRCADALRRALIALDESKDLRSSDRGFFLFPV